MRQNFYLSKTFQHFEISVQIESCHISHFTLEINYILYHICQEISYLRYFTQNRSSSNQTRQLDRIIPLLISPAHACSIFLSICTSLHRMALNFTSLHCTAMKSFCNFRVKISLLQKSKQIKFSYFCEVECINNVTKHRKLTDNAMYCIQHLHLYIMFIYTYPAGLTDWVTLPRLGNFTQAG